MYDELSTFTHPTEYRPNQCAVCSRYFCDADIAETITTDASSVTAASESSGHCCQHCAETAGRKYDGPASLILSAWAGISMEDDWMSDDSGEWVGRFGRWLLMESSTGFVTSEEFSDSDKAQARFDEIYADGMGAEEDDAYIGHEMYRGWHASMGGKALNVYERPDGTTDRTRALAAVVLEMYRTGFFPNIWEENHYGISLVKDCPGIEWATSKGYTNEQLAQFQAQAQEAAKP